MREHQPHPGPSLRFPDLYKDQSYRGYLVVTNHLAGSVMVKRDGAVIWTGEGAQATLGAAKAMIDSILE